MFIYAIFKLILSFLCMKILPVSEFWQSDDKKVALEDAFGTSSEILFVLNSFCLKNDRLVLGGKPLTERSSLSIITSAG